MSKHPVGSLAKSLKRNALLITAACAFSAALIPQSLQASPKTDSIVTFLGGAHAKFVWPRWAWCNENYQPKTKAAAVAEGMSLMLMDTREGTERALATGLKNAGEPRISRSGKWATFTEDKKSYIVDLTTSTPVKKVLLDATTTSAYYYANCWWIDPANGDEYVFATDNTDKGSTAIWRFKVNADGTAGAATKVKINSAAYIVGGISVSADGKKLGAAFPWPDTKILDIATGNLLDRHNGMFGCQPNLAPDNSYRFFHCEDDHLGIMMFGSDLQDNTNWFVNLSINLAGVPNPNKETVMDFMAPRWTNHVQYLTAQCPMGDNFENYCANPNDQSDEGWMNDNGSSLWGLSAASVQKLSLIKVPKFFIGKFAADFKTQEKSIMVGADPRYMQYTGDGWICNGTTYGNPCTTTRALAQNHTAQLPRLSVVRRGSQVIVGTNGIEPVSINVIDSQGSIVKTIVGKNIIDTRGFGTGVYIVSISQGDRRVQVVVSCGR